MSKNKRGENMKYFEYLRTHEYSENTIKNYKAAWKQFCSFIFTHNGFELTESSLSHLTKEHLEQYMVYLKDKGISPKTRNTRRIEVISILKYYGIIIEIDKVRYEKKIMQYYNINEYQNLLDNITGETETRDRALISLLCTTGIRLSELNALNVGDIQRGDYFVVRGKGNKERVIPLAEATKQNINDYLLTRNNTAASAPLFSVTQKEKRMSVRTIQNIVRKYELHANLTKTGVHILRHTFATNYYHNNRDIYALQKLLGHAKIETTSQYVHMENGELKDGVQNMELVNITKNSN